MKRRLLLTLSLLAMTGPAFALLAVEKPHVQAELLSEVLSVQPARSFWVAVRFKADPEWHTYWKNPGDSGTSTRIAWILPDGFKAGPIVWPAPHRIVQDPLVSYGHVGESYFLTEITAPAVMTQSKNVVIKARVYWLECKESCIPGKAELKVELPVAIEDPLPNPNTKGNFSLARFQTPLSKSEWAITASQDEKNISIVLTPPSWFNNPSPVINFFPDQPGLIENAGPQKVFQTEGKVVVIIPRAEVSTMTFSSLVGVLTADFGWTGPQTESALNVMLDLPQGKNPYSEPMSKPANVSLWAAILLAFIGGLILNLMPCVLPVLSIKVMGFVKEESSRKEGIINGCLFLLGVLISFWTLAGALLALRRSGEAVGWGFQLQSAPFVASLAGLFFLMALNLFGLFEVGLSLTRLSGASAKNSKALSSFLGGVLATIVATPCTAPFMGSALGYALTVGPGESMLIFTFLGLGMGMPYVILAAFPKLVSFIPKPGPWMDTFKQSMGFLFLATVVWLIWVLDRQGTAYIPAIVGAFFVLGMSGWCYGKFQFATGKKAVVWIVLCLILLAAGVSAGLKSIHPKEEVTVSKGAMSWETYSEEKVEAARKEGRIVFVDFTAAWCLSCQVNEKVAFSSEEVINQFKEKNVAAFKADWTSYDPAITKTLHANGRDGVPLYLVYKPNQEGPMILPAILTPGIVLEAIN